MGNLSQKYALESTNHYLKDELKTNARKYSVINETVHCNNSFNELDALFSNI